MMSRLVVGLGIWLLASVQALALSPAAPMMVPGPPSMPGNFQQGDQYYDGSVTGLSDYMVDLKTRDAQAYSALEADIESLRSRRMWSYIAPAALLAGSLGFQIAGSSNLSLPVVSLSLVLALAAVPAYWIISPGRSDYLNFINKHNRLRPNSPLRLNVGALPGAGVYYARVAISF